MMGLSATLGDPERGKVFLAGDAPESVTFIQDTSSAREVRFALKAMLKPPDPREIGKGAKRLTPAESRALVHDWSPERLRNAGEAPTTGSQTKSDRVNEPTPDDLDDIADDLIRHFAKSTNLVFVNSRRTAEELAVRVHDRVATLKWPHDPFMIHHGSVAKELREETEAALKSGLPTTAICSSTLEMGIDIGSVRAIGQIEPPWSVASLMQRLGRSGRREGESSIMRLYVREETPHGGSRLIDLLFPELLRGIALAQLMQEKWLEPVDDQRMHLSTLIHQVLSHLKQTGGMTAAKMYQALAVDGPFRFLSSKDFSSLIHCLAKKQVIEQIPTGEVILAPSGERITSAHDFYAAFKGTEMFTVRHGKSEIGEIPFDALPPAGQLIVLAGRRWLVEEVDTSSKTLWVSPAKGGKIPVFRGNAGELHTSVVQKMKTVLLSDDVPPYLDEPARELLATARDVARRVGLESCDVLIAPGGIRWFPWVGTRCLRTLAILTEINGLVSETDRLSIWLPVSGLSTFRDFIFSVLERRYDPQDLGARVFPRIVEKFDELVPDDLLNRACASDRLVLDEARAALQSLLDGNDIRAG